MGDSEPGGEQKKEVTRHNRKGMSVEEGETKVNLLGVLSTHLISSYTLPLSFRWKVKN